MDIENGYCYTVGEVSHILQMSPLSIRRLLNDGELVGFKPRDKQGSGWKIRKSDLDKWIEDSIKRSQKLKDKKMKRIIATEAAQKLGCSIKEVENLFTSKKIPAFWNGAEWEANLKNLYIYYISDKNPERYSNFKNKLEEELKKTKASDEYKAEPEEDVRNAMEFATKQNVEDECFFRIKKRELNSTKTWDEFNE